MNNKKIIFMVLFLLVLLPIIFAQEKLIIRTETGNYTIIGGLTEELRQLVGQRVSATGFNETTPQEFRIDVTNYDIISLCGNQVCDEGETAENCPEDCFLQTGEQTKITNLIQGIADNIEGNSSREIIQNIMDWEHETLRNCPENFDKMANLRRRTTEEIVNSQCASGCIDFALVFVALARAKNIPASFSETVNEKWIHDMQNSGEWISPALGHVFSDVYLEDEGIWTTVDPTNTSFVPRNDEYYYMISGPTANQKYILIEKGLDSWDIGILNHDDFVKLIQERFLNLHYDVDEEPANNMILPSNWDWRDIDGINYMTPVKDQGGCGACWAFSANGVIEATYKIKNKNPKLNIDLSEQDLITCAPNAGSCSGGSAVSAAQYAQECGVRYEQYFPYTGLIASDDPIECRLCTSGLDEKVFVNNYEFAENSGTKMKQLLVEKGPLVVSLCWPRAENVDENGIAHCDEDPQGRCEIRHAMVLVGYDDEGEYWITKNSWGLGGPEWAETGYVKFGYGECHIENNLIAGHYPYAVEVK